MSNYIDHLFFFNDRLEQRDLRRYHIDLHQMSRVGRHVAVDARSDIRFAIAQGMLPWQPILSAKSAKSAKKPSFLGLVFHNGCQDGKADTLIPLMSSLHRIKI